MQGPKADNLVVENKGPNPANEVRLTDDPGEEVAPAFSPDGLAIAFHRTDESGGGQGLGAEEVWVMTREVVGGKWGAPRQLTDLEVFVLHRLRRPLACGPEEKLRAHVA